MDEPSAPSELVAFDFDGTLTVRDSYTAFLRWRAGPGGYAAGGLRLLPDLLAYPWRRDRGALKAAATRAYLKGMPRAELEADAERFAALRFDSLMRPDALRCWAGWAGRARRVIVTASPEPVVAPFARRLSADGLLGTRLRYDAQDRVTGGFEGPNCRGEAKVERLRRAFGSEVRLRAAYGDTSGDREMLALADAPHMKVFTGVPTAG